jgi:hypothetical protein
MILIKRWEKHINIYATFVDDDNLEDMTVPYQSPRNNIPSGMYDLIIHLALYINLMSN